MKLLLRRIRSMDFGKMKDFINRVHQESHKSKIRIFIDMCYCAIKYNVGYLEYYVFGFIFLKKNDRLTYMTMPISNLLFKKLNTREMIKKFDNKIEFNQIFDDLLGRRWLNLETSSLDEFTTFAQEVKTLFVKPVDECSGKGIEKIVIDEHTDMDKLYHYLLNNHQYDIEECIIQHPKMALINPTSINTLRITSILKDGEVHIMYTIMRTSDGTKSVDNIGSGGYYCPVNSEGIVFKPGFSENLGVSELHPYTHVPFVGFKVPLYDQAIELIKKAAVRTPDLRYCGWDVAISVNGPVLVEGNPMPGYDLAQNHYHLPTKQGYLPKFKEVLKEEL